ncbi:MAG: hypothetical protein ABSG21_05970 [Spirochaetia bacterium]|jgi:hypothetical protein
MARTRAFALFAAVLLALSGCSAFFDFNAFSSLDKASVPDPSRYQGASGLANLQKDLASPSVVSALKSSYATSQQILTNLESSYSVHSGPLSSPDQKTAAILYADLALASTSGDILANNIVASAMSTSQTGNIASLINSVIPSDVIGDPTKFTNMISGLLDANVVYLNLGSHLGTPPQPVPGMNMGDTAQKAAVAYMVNTIVNAVMTQATLTQPQAISQMYLLVNNDPTTLPAVSAASITDPFTPLDPNLKAIFDAAGAPYPK